MRARVIAFGYFVAGVVAAGGLAVAVRAGCGGAGLGVAADAAAGAGGGGGAAATFFLAQAAVSNVTTATAIRVRFWAWFILFPSYVRLNPLRASSGILSGQDFLPTGVELHSEVEEVVLPFCIPTRAVRWPVRPKNTASLHG